MCECVCMCVNVCVHVCACVYVGAKKGSFEGRGKCIQC